MTGSYSMPPPGEEAHARRQITVIVLLLFGMVALYQFEQFAQHPFDPSGMLALGFVVLASFTIGGLVGQIRLPHITGYLIAGLVFGPSLARALAGLGLPAPFDRGILNAQVIEQLSLFDTLAVGLIAITAGGELKLAALKKGLRTISSILAAQIVFVGLFVTAFVWLIAGAVPYIGLPGIQGLPMAAVLAVGAMAAFTLAERPMAPQVLMIVAVLGALAVPSLGLWLGSGVLVARYLRTERAMRIFNIALGCLCIASVVFIFV